MEQIIKIVDFIVESFIHIWPYLLITIPLAVVTKITGISNYINKALRKKIWVSIILATAVGAISPFCSCGVIPIITTLLIGGVPLAPVMSFWLASPSMDPEIFLLSVASIGWDLSVWRLLATFVISIAAGVFTYILQKRGYLGTNILRTDKQANDKVVEKSITYRLGRAFKNIFQSIIPKRKQKVILVGIKNISRPKANINCCVSGFDIVLDKTEVQDCACSASKPKKKQTLSQTIAYESWLAFLMVAKFMLLAFFINALIKFYVPEHFLTRFMGTNNPFSVLISALMGIPFYTSNLTALPLVSGLISLGMNNGAALAFLIAGPVTTLPAMAAVWGIVKPKVFIIYLGFSLFGAIIFGYLFNIFN